MGQITFDKCCFCIDLKTGCFIIGYLNLIANIIFVIMSGLALGGGLVIVNKAEDQEAKNVGVTVVASSVIMLLFTILFLAFTIVFLVGLHKNKPGHVKAFLIYGVVFAVLSVIQIIVSIAGGATSVSIIIQQVIALLLNIYFLLVIRSQYFAMRNPSNGPAIYNKA